MITIVFIAFLSFTNIAAQQENRVAENQKTVLLFVKIPEPITPLERAQKYEEPLNKFLTAKRLGEVSGGGTMLTIERKIDFVGIDIDVYDPIKALPQIIKKLRDLGVPKGTVIEQTEPVKKVIKVK